MSQSTEAQQLMTRTWMMSQFFTATQSERAKVSANVLRVRFEHLRTERGTQQPATSKPKVRRENRADTLGSGCVVGLQQA